MRWEEIMDPNDLFNLFTKFLKGWLSANRKGTDDLIANPLKESLKDKDGELIFGIRECIMHLILKYLNAWYILIPAYVMVKEYDASYQQKMYCCKSQKKNCCSEEIL